MIRGLLLATVVGAAAFPAAAAADNTPSGPAKLSAGYVGSAISCPGFLGGPGVIVAWEVEVGEGGQGGIVRPVFGDVVGDVVDLPSQPGRYRFAAPHLYRDLNLCGQTVGLIQATGEHAVLLRDAPADQYVNVVREGQPDERVDGARLATSLVVEGDTDRDLRGDLTEDRADLRVTTRAVRESDGRARIEILLTNKGPRAADLPQLEASGLPGVRWEGACAPIRLYSTCATPKLEVGASRRFVVRGDLPGAVAGGIAVASEGPDLAGLDNRAAVILQPAPAFDLVAAPSQRLKHGIKVQVRAIRAGRIRLTAAFKIRGRTVKVGTVIALKPYAPRTVTIRASKAKLRSIRRALANGALNAEIAAKTINGKSPVTTKIKITR